MAYSRWYPHNHYPHSLCRLCIRYMRRYLLTGEEARARIQKRRGRTPARGLGSRNGRDLDLKKGVPIDGWTFQRETLA